MGLHPGLGEPRCLLSSLTCPGDKGQINDKFKDRMVASFTAKKKKHRSCNLFGNALCTFGLQVVSHPCTVLPAQTQNRTFFLESFCCYMSDEKLWFVPSFLIQIFAQTNDINLFTPQALSYKNKIEIKEQKKSLF